MNTNPTNNLMQNPKFKSVKPYFLVTAVCQLITLILWFVPTMKLSAISGTYYSTGNTSYSASTDSYAITQLFEGVLVVNIIFIALMALSLFFIIKPVIFNKLDKPVKLILPKIASVVILAIYLILFWVSKGETKKYAEYGAVCKLNFGGWLFIIFDIAIFVLSIVATGKLKEIKASMPAEPISAQ